VALERVLARSPMTTAGPPRSCSYQGQDLFVLDVLGHLRGGFFLDSGASDGVNGSNSRLFETQLGWSGICIEPNDALFAQLARNRTCTCLNCCLYDRPGTVDFLEAGGVFGGILEAYDPSHLRYARAVLAADGVDDATPPVVPKPARTIRSVLRDCGAPRVIDYWSLDTEGSELAILRSFPFDEYAVRVLTVEHNSTPAREEIRLLLEGRGFRRARALGIDDGYTWSGGLSTEAWRSRAWSRSGRGALRS
jgi:Methyltransferase FkbM domain